jgi:hypothetical protein
LQKSAGSILAALASPIENKTNHFLPTKKAKGKTIPSFPKVQLKVGKNEKTTNSI